jgi:hypothetical protein
MHSSRHLTVPCSRCGRAAAGIALLPADPDAEAREARQERLERTDFMGRVVQFGAHEQLLTFFAALAQQDYASARGADADFVAFHCRACGKACCQQCWRIGPPVFDEGFYSVVFACGEAAERDGDCTFGVCPEGHEQVVDD